MKRIIIIAGVLYFIVLSSSYGYDKDSIELSIYPDTLISEENNNNIYFTIKNNSSDTLLIVNEFYAEGLIETFA